MLLIITKADIEAEIADLFKQEEIPKHELRMESTENLIKTNMLLNVGDYGVLPFRESDSYIKQVLGKIIMASKTGEYLSSGLPVIVDERVGGASNLIRREALGVVYSQNRDDEFIEKLQAVDNDYREVSNRCVQVANNNFSTKKHAHQYHELYLELIDYEPSCNSNDSHL